VGLRLLLLVGALALVLAVPAGSATRARDVSAYDGLGTWVDVWDGTVWKAPEAAVSAMAAHDVTTLYLETSNYTRTVDLFQPDGIGRFLDAAHAAGIRVVAWYLPSFANVARDLRRSLAAIRYRSPSGEAFDSFALDIEASVVKPPAKRTARVLALAARLRAAAGEAYPLGAIIPAPRGMDLNPTYWPGFPYQQLTRSFDVFLPMGYFTYRFKTAAASSDYTQANVDLLRERAGDETLPVHVVGGLASAASVAQVHAFAQTALSAGASGASLYDYASTKPAQWRALEGVFSTS
jgi:hypothetical protein